MFVINMFALFGLLISLAGLFYFCREVYRLMFPKDLKWARQPVDQVGSLSNDELFKKIGSGPFVEELRRRFGAMVVTKKGIDTWLKRLERILGAS